MTEQHPDSRIGRVFGDFEVRRLLGAGGMGEVYLAWDRSLDRLAALKFLRETYAHDAAIVERFYREAKAAAKLNHPNIVTVYSVGTADDLPYMAIEYVEGVSLRDLLTQKGRLSWGHALRYAGQVAAALDCAHRQHIVHRDIKPENVLVDREGRARVADFGLAKALHADSDLTRDGMVLGTPNYMSPEHCGVGDIVPASDFFSLGVMVYEMISGRRPFKGETPVGLAHSIASDTPPPLTQFVPDLPPEAEELTQRLLEKDPSRRLASGFEFNTAVAAMRTSRVTSSPPPVAASGTSPASGEDEKTRASESRAGVSSPTQPMMGASPVEARSPEPAAPNRRWLWTGLIVVGLLLVAGMAARMLLRHGPDEGRAKAPARERSQVEERPQAPSPPPATQGKSETGYETVAPGVLAYPLPQDDLRVEYMAWDAGRTVLIVHAAGKGSSEAQALAGLSPDLQVVRMLALDAPRTRIEALNRKRVTVRVPGEVAARSPLSNSLLLMVPGRVRGAGYERIISRSIEEDEFQIQEVYRSELPPLGRGRLLRAEGCFDVAAKPDGETLCMVLVKQGAPGTPGGMFLVERDVDSMPKGRVSDPLNEPRGRITSLCYSPDGAFIAYDRIMPGGRAELWLVRSGGAERDGVRLSEGPGVATRVAFSPDGRFLVFCAVPAPRKPGQLVLFDLTEQPANGVAAGRGRIGAQPWDPTSGFFVAADKDSQGNDQLWAVDTGEDCVRIPLTKLQRGALTPEQAMGMHGPCLSYDGKWAAIEYISESGGGILFIDMDDALR